MGSSSSKPSKSKHHKSSKHPISKKQISYPQPSFEPRPTVPSKRYRDPGRPPLPPAYKPSDPIYQHYNRKALPAPPINMRTKPKNVNKAMPALPRAERVRGDPRVRHGEVGAKPQVVRGPKVKSVAAQVVDRRAHVKSRVGMWELY